MFINLRSASSSNDDTSRGIDDTIDNAIATTTISSSRVDDTRSTNNHSRGTHNSDHRNSYDDREVVNSRRSSRDNNRLPPSIGAGDLISNTRNSSHVNDAKSTTTTTTTTKPTTTRSTTSTTTRSTTAATITATIATGSGSKVRWLSDSNDDNNDHRMNDNHDYHIDDCDATRNKVYDDHDNRDANLSRLVNSNRSSWYDDDDDVRGDRRSHSYNEKHSSTVLDGDDDDDDSGDGGKQLIDVLSDSTDADRDDGDVEVPLSSSDTVEMKSYDDVYNYTNNNNNDHDNRITKNVAREHDGSIVGRTRATTDNRNDGDDGGGGRGDDDTDSIRMTELIDRYISNSSQSQHSEKQKKMINRSDNDYDDDDGRSDDNGGNGSGSRVSHIRSIHSIDSSRYQDDDNDNDDDNSYDIINKSNTSINEKSNSINGDSDGCDNNRYRNHNMMVKMKKKKISNRTEHVSDMFAKYLHETHHDPRHISPSLQRLQSYLDNNNHPNHDNINHHHGDNSRHRSYSSGRGGAEHEKPPWKPSSNTSKHILKISTTNAVDHDRSLSNHHHHHHTRDDDFRGGGVNGMSVIGNRLSKTVSRSDIDRLIQANRQVSIQSLKGDGIDDCGNSINSSKTTTTTTTNTTNTTSRMSTKTVDT